MRGEDESRSGPQHGLLCVVLHVYTCSAATQEPVYTQVYPPLTLSFSLLPPLSRSPPLFLSPTVQRIHWVPPLQRYRPGPFRHTPPRPLPHDSLRPHQYDYCKPHHPLLSTRSTVCALLTHSSHSLFSPTLLTHPSHSTRSLSARPSPALNPLSALSPPTLRLLSALSPPTVVYALPLLGALDQSVSWAAFYIVTFQIIVNVAATKLCIAVGYASYKTNVKDTLQRQSRMRWDNYKRAFYLLSDKSDGVTAYVCRGVSAGLLLWFGLCGCVMVQ